MAKFHFISGLPRSGSTLLSAILKQNPRFSAGMTSPVGLLCSSLLPNMSGATEFPMFFNDEKRARILRAVFDAYYADQESTSVVFDTNRHWTSRMALINQLYPGSRVICCVRNIGWIIDSLERAIRKNPLQQSRLAGEKGVSTIYSRIDGFMNADSGIIGFPWSALREAWFGDQASNLIVVPYDRLASAPEEVIKQLYEQLGEPLFPHTFDNLEFEEEEYDQRAATPGLHKVRREVKLEKRDPIIPPDIFKKYDNSNFWINKSLNTRGVLIL